MRKILASLSALAVMWSMSGAVHADDYGCRVMLCLSNPNGPMAEQQCQPPIQKFLEGQAKEPKDPFPSCPEAAPSTMTPFVRPYDKCPAGTTTLGESIEVLQLSPAQFKDMQKNAIRLGNYIDLGDNGEWPVGIVGIGEGDMTTRSQQQNKICVSNPLGTLKFKRGSSSVDGNAEYKSYQVYEKAATIAPADKPRVVDIYIDGSLYRSVRY
ncbi:MAG: hypothetical protein DI563_05385 [Variovorax paradoxus]|uniref:Uncharacterized protein n=1 Tax=Variovorax paradoxus TaxID=34073 RepID=A0A2W5QIG8_VARPD|nr:MAG: hypothetical protein DI563_05385 [Variovorax paradoxus]